MAKDLVYKNNNMSTGEAEKLIKNEYGDVVLTTKYYSMDNLTLWFIGEPDEYYQNYIAQMGSNALVINAKE
jgi:hypothetical protein